MIRTNIRPFPLLCAISWLKRNSPTPPPIPYSNPHRYFSLLPCLFSFLSHTHIISAPHHHPPLLYLQQFLDFLVHFLEHPFIAALPSVIYTLIRAPVFKKHYAKVATAMQTRQSSIFGVSWRLTRVCRPREYCLLQLRGKYVYLNTRRVWQSVCAAWEREGGGRLWAFGLTQILPYCGHFIFFY